MFGEDERYEVVVRGAPVWRMVELPQRRRTVFVYMLALQSQISI